jgi:hypothetical protein
MTRSATPRRQPPPLHPLVLTGHTLRPPGTDRTRCVPCPHTDGTRLCGQAFSHFTWHASKGALLICDIQGVGDLYTDPQIHSSDGRGYGLGNLGQKGIDRFLPPLPVLTGQVSSLPSY